MLDKLLNSHTSHQELDLSSPRLSLVTSGRNARTRKTHLDILSSSASSLDASGPTPASAFMLVVTKDFIHSHHFSIRSSRITMDTAQATNISLTWTIPSLNAQTSQPTKMQWSTPLESVLDVTLLITHSVPHALVNKDWKSNLRLLVCSRVSQVNLKANIILSATWAKVIESNLLLITSYSKAVTNILRVAASSATGPKHAESSTTTTKLSLCGSTKRISFVSSRCSLAPTSDRSSRDYQPQLLRLRRRPSSPTTLTLATSPHAPPILELECALRYISSFQSYPRKKTNSKQSLTSTTSRSVAPMENILRAMTVSTIFPTSVDSDAPKSISSRICTMVLKPWSRLRNVSELFNHDKSQQPTRHKRLKWAKNLLFI